MTAWNQANQCHRVSAVGNESGVALASATFALAIIGALVASSFFAGRLEQQSGSSTLFVAQAREAAEAGLAQAMAGLAAETMENLPAGGAPIEIGATVIGEGVTAQTRVTRLTSRLFLIRSDGQRRDREGTVLANRSLGLLVQLTAPASAEAQHSSIVRRLEERGWLHLY